VKRLTDQLLSIAAKNHHVAVNVIKPRSAKLVLFGLQDEEPSTSDNL